MVHQALVALMVGIRKRQPGPMQASNFGVTTLTACKAVSKWLGTSNAVHGNQAP
jgi:hypothetical protein